MKYISVFIIGQFVLLASVSAQKKIDFSGQKINLSGWVNNLTVEGHEEKYVEIIQGVSNSSEEIFEDEIRMEEFYLSFRPNTGNVIVRVPKSINISLDMEAIVYETKFDHNQESDWKKVLLKDLAGSVSFNGDGYDLEMKNVNGSVAVVTYGDIEFESSDLSNAELISLDTYWGEVLASIPASMDANVTARAKSGNVLVDDAFYANVKKNNKHKFISTNDNAKIDIILHGESGREVVLKGN